MSSTPHRLLTPSKGIHAPFADQYANAAARNAATGFPGPSGPIIPFSLADVGKVVLQIDTWQSYILTAITPSWVAVADAVGAAAAAQTAAIAAAATDATTKANAAQAAAATDATNKVATETTRATTAEAAAQSAAIAAAATDATTKADAAQAAAIQRANHTGTQLLATIFDAGNAAGKNVGTGSTNVAAGDAPAAAQAAAATYTDAETTRAEAAEAAAIATAATYTDAETTRAEAAEAAAQTTANAAIPSGTGAIVDADVNASAAIAGSKVNPDFGSQSITTIGSLTIFSGNINCDGNITSGTGVFNGNGSGLLNLPAGQLVGALPGAIADGTYTVGIGGTTNGTITVVNGIITAIQEAS